MRAMLVTGLVLVVLGVAGCHASTSPVPAPPANGGGSVESGSSAGDSGGSSGGDSGGSSDGDVTTEQAAPHKNVVVHSPIDFDPTIPQFQSLYGTASYSDFRSALWSYFDGLCTDHCGIRVTADYECADQDSASCTVDHVDFTNPLHDGDTVTVVLTDPNETTTEPSDSEDTTSPAGE
jgi:hypothetical protein